MASAAFVDRHGPGGIVHNPASAYSREMAKWEMGYSPYGPPGRPRELLTDQEKLYPAAFYKMRRSEMAYEVAAGPFVVEHFTTAADENEAANLRSRGYGHGREEAQQMIIDAEKELSFASAVSNKDDLRMSEKAKQERAAFEDSTSKHVAEIPATPVKRRGRPRKVAETVSAQE